MDILMKQGEYLSQFVKTKEGECMNLEDEIQFEAKEGRRILTYYMQSFMEEKDADLCYVALQDVDVLAELYENIMYALENKPYVDVKQEVKKTLDFNEKWLLEDLKKAREQEPHEGR